MSRLSPPIDVDDLIPTAERADDATLIAALEKRFVTGSLRGRQAIALQDCIKSGKSTDDQTILDAIRLVLCTPEFQLT